MPPVGRRTPVAAGAAVAPWHKARPIVLPADATIDDAIAAIAAGCRDHWHANVAAALAGEHPEGIHQVRVGLRRFRVFLSLFRDHFPADQHAWLKAETKALGDALAPARDLDVFLTQLMAPLADKTAHNSDIAALLRAARDARDLAHSKGAAVLVSKRYHRFMSRLNAWIAGRGWRGTDLGSTPAKQFARVVLNRRLAKIVARTKRIEKSRPATLHRLRIAIKKVRYGLEFFQSALPRKRVVRTGRLLKGLQEALGYLNDLDVATRTLAVLSNSIADAATKRAILRGGQKLKRTFAHGRKSALPKAAELGVRLRAQKPL